jgi:hypothetical protein
MFAVASLLLADDHTPSHDGVLLPYCAAGNCVAVIGCHRSLDARYGGAPIVGRLFIDAVTALSFTGAVQFGAVHAGLFA